MSCQEPELAEKGMRNTGSENYGGPVVTAGQKVRRRSIRALLENVFVKSSGC